MEAIKTRGVAKDGLLTVSVPHQFDEQDLEVIVLSGIEKNIESGIGNNIQGNHQERIKRLMNIVGTAKYPNAPIENYDLYVQ